MLTKGAIGNLVNRYKAVLKKCNLINTFGSLAVASMLVLGGAGVANAATATDGMEISHGKTEIYEGSNTEIVYIVGIPTDENNTPKGNNPSIEASGGIKNVDTVIFKGNWGTGADGAVNAVEASANTPNAKIEFIDINHIGYDGEITNSGSATTVLFHAYGGTINLDKIGSINLDYGGSAFYANAYNGGSGIINVTNVGSVEVSSVFVVNKDENIWNADAKISINADNITLNGPGRAIYLRDNSSHSANIDINANKILSINGSGLASGTDYGVICTYYGSDDENSFVKLNGKEVNITNTNGGLAINAVDGSVEIGATSERVVISGNIQSGYGADVDVNLGTNGSLTGKVSTDDYSTTALGIGTDSIWNVTGASNVTTIDADGGVVDMSGTADNVAVKNLEGTGLDVVMDAAKTNTFSVAEETSTKVTAKAASGNADTLTTDDAEAMAKRVTSADGTTPLEGVTAEVAEGIVNAGFTTDSEGKIVSGGGASSVTKAVLEAASVNTVALDRILTNDVRKRLGDIRSDANKTGVWMRWDGGKLKGDAGLTNEFNTIQIGGDTKVAKNCRLGVAGSFTHGEGDFARGSSELEGFSFAAYATWMGDNGMFADIVARIGHFSTEVNVEGQSGDMDNRVASISGEYGWRFNLCQQFFIEPQVELAYTYVNSDDLELETAKFSFDSVDSLTGRVGLVAGWNLPDDRGNVYARASVVQQFMGDAKVTGFSGVAPTVHETDGDDTWLEYGIGANVKLTDNAYIWADVERTEGAEIDEEWRGTVGVRFSF